MSENVVLHLHRVNISISFGSTSIMVLIMILCIRVGDWWTQTQPAVSPPTTLQTALPDSRHTRAVI